MAERRMFAKTIVLSDAFLDLPMGSRCLYTTLGMMADDDGFVNSPRSVMRLVGASSDDFETLIKKHFIIAFEDGVICIKHWKINNFIRSDRYSETKYIEDKNRLMIDKNGAYTFKKQEEKIVAPSIKDIQDYINEKNYHVNADAFFSFYAEHNWSDTKGNSIINCWKQKVKLWESNLSNRKEKSKLKYAQTRISDEEFDSLCIDLDKDSV